MEVIVTSKLGYSLFKGLVTYLYRGDITQLLTSMDIQDTDVRVEKIVTHMS